MSPSFAGLLFVLAVHMCPLHKQSPVCVPFNRSLLPKSFLMMLDAAMAQEETAALKCSALLIPNT